MNGGGPNEVLDRIRDDEKLKEMGIRFGHQIDFYSGRNSIIYKGLSLSSANPPSPLILKMVSREHMDLDKLDRLLRKYANCLPRVLHYEAMDRWIFFIVDEVKTFRFHQDLSPQHVIDILRIIKLFARHRVFYGDISHKNFGYQDGRILLLDFSDLLDSRRGLLRCLPEYAPPELPPPSAPPLTQEGLAKALSFIFAMFVVETKVSQQAANHIQALMTEAKNMSTLAKFDPISVERITHLLSQLVRKIIADSLGTRRYGPEDEKDASRIAAWSPTLIKMLLFDWRQRPPIGRIAL